MAFFLSSESLDHPFTSFASSGSSGDMEFGDCPVSSQSLLGVLWLQGLTVFCNGFLIRRSQVRVLPGVLRNSQQTTDDNSSQKMRKSANNKVVTASKAEGDLAPNKPAKVPTDDSTNTANVTNSDKPDNKPRTTDSELAEKMLLNPTILTQAVFWQKKGSRICRIPVGIWNTAITSK